MNTKKFTKKGTKIFKMATTNRNRSKFAITIIALTFMMVLGKANSQTCQVLNTEPQKASPSLVQCYRDNANTCCNSVTDYFIQELYNGLFSDSC